MVQIRLCPSLFCNGTNTMIPSPVQNVWKTIFKYMYCLCLSFHCEWTRELGTVWHWKITPSSSSHLPLQSESFKNTDIAAKNVHEHGKEKWQVIVDFALSECSILYNGSYCFSYDRGVSISFDYWLYSTGGNVQDFLKCRNLFRPFFAESQPEMR